MGIETATHFVLTCGLENIAIDLEVLDILIHPVRDYGRKETSHACADDADLGLPVLGDKTESRNLLCFLKQSGRDQVAISCSSDGMLTLTSFVTWLMLSQSGGSQAIFGSLASPGNKSALDYGRFRDSR